jgi:signal transduction histidine kinase
MAETTPPISAVQAEHAPLLFRLSQLLGSSLEIQEVLETLIDEILSHTGAERGFIVVRPEGSTESAVQWQFHTARSLDPDNLDREEFRVSKGIIDKVAQTGKSILTDDASGDDRFRGQTSVHLYNLRAILCVPLMIASRIIGVIYVDNRVMSGAFKRETQALLESIAGPAAVAVENALLYDQLRRVYERSLQAARRELAQTQAQLHHASKMAAVGQLAAGVAHEVNNPLGAIQLNLSGIRAASSEKGFQRRLDLCERALERCRSVVSRLLTFAHPGANPGEEGSQQPCLFEVANVLDKTLDLVEPDLGQYQIRLVRKLDPALQLELVEDDLCQVVLNLVLNSRDSLKNVERPVGREIAVLALAEDGRCHIRVQDNGEGIDPAVRERIFEPFFTTKQVGQGVGLGLSICYQLVGRNGGTIGLDPGPDTCFHISLPLPVQRAEKTRGDNE